MRAIAYTMSALIMTATASMTAQTAASTTATATAGTRLNTDDTDLGTLLDNSAAKAVLTEHIREIVANVQIDMGRAMTLTQLQNFAGDQLTDEALDKIDADLAKIPAK